MRTPAASEVVEIQSQGSGLWVPLPMTVARKGNLRVGQRVRVVVESVQGATTGHKANLTLEKRLDLYDASRHGRVPWTR